MEITVALHLGLSIMMPMFSPEPPIVVDLEVVPEPTLVLRSYESLNYHIIALSDQPVMVLVQ